MNFSEYVNVYNDLVVSSAVINISELVSFLQNRTDITRLSLKNVGVDNEGARELAELTNLTELNLSDNDISDEGAKTLAKLTNLTKLYLSNNNISDEAIRGLRAELTNCAVHNQVMKSEQWKEILSAISEQEDLSKDNVIEKIKERLEVENKSNYHEWEQDNFNVDHLFASDEALLHFAISVGHPRVVKALIAKGANVNLAGKEDGWTPLYYAAGKGRYISEEGFEERLRVWHDVSETSQSVGTSLATQDRYVEIVDALIDGGADIRDRNTRVPLNWAIWNGHLDIANTLINRGAGINKIDWSKNTPLHIAAMMGYVEIANTLIRHGAIIDSYSSSGGFRTPLSLAIEYKRVEVAKVLIENGADIKRYYRARSSPWADAVHSSTDIIKLMIESGADINVTYKGSTILEEIVRRHEDICEFVIDHIEKLEADGLYVNKASLDFKDRLKSRIFLHNHRPLIDALPEHYGRDFQMMKFTDIKTFFEKHKDDELLKDIKSKLPVIAASMLAITGVATGIAIAVYLEMLAVGIAVGVCCLIAATIIYCCRPKSSIENSNVEKSFGVEKEENVEITCLSS